MKNGNIKINFKNCFYYLLGFVLVGLGVNLMNSSTLGMGAWDTVTYNIFSFITEKLNHESISFWFGDIILKPGHISMLVSLTILVIVITYRRRLSLLFMLVPIFFVGNFINMWYLIFDNYQANNIMLQIILFTSGMFTIPLGLVLVVKSTFPAFVFEEWTFMMSDVFKTSNFARVRLGIEITGISLGSLFGALTFLSEGHLGEVSMGSLVMAVFFGKIMALEMKILGVNKIKELGDNNG